MTGEKYEDYVTAEILKPLDMQESFFRTNDAGAKKAVQGYKTGFLSPRPYDAPTYYGNTAAGYLVSNHALHAYGDRLCHSHAKPVLLMTIVRLRSLGPHFLDVSLVLLYNFIHQEAILQRMPLIHF